jgi:cytochrome c
MSMIPNDETQPNFLPSPLEGEGVRALRSSASGRKGGVPPLRWMVPIVAVVVSASASLAADANRGEQLFVECASCHTLEKGVHNVGPSLAGLFQRKSGSFDDYRFSPAMKRANITWTAEQLDKFIADPQTVVPANRMPYAGMTNAADRADLIAYLQKAAQ